MKKYLGFIVPLLAILLCLLSLFTTVDNKINDQFMRLLKPLKESPNVALVNVDNTAIENIGTFPVPRNVYADSVIELRELGASDIVFDLSFLDPSPRTVDAETADQDLPATISDSFSMLSEAVNDEIDTYTGKNLSKNIASSMKETVEGLSESARNSINVILQYAIKNQDKYFANCLRFFNNAFLTLTMTENPDEKPSDPDYLEKNIAIENITVEKDTKTPEYAGITPAIQVLMQNALRAGFVNASPDKDGYLRRLDLLVKYNGKYYGQLAFIPVWNRLGQPDIIVSNKYIILKNARISDDIIHDIKIPRDENGKVIVKYPPKQYVEYRATSLWNIFREPLLEKELVQNLVNLDSDGFFGVWDEEQTPFDYYYAAEKCRNDLLTKTPDECIALGSTYDKYYELRKNFIKASRKFVSEEYQAMLIEEYEAEGEMLDYVNECFDGCREQFEEIINHRNNVHDVIGDAICIMGTCATSTTDNGNTMYEKQYPNVGVHYTIANQLLSEDFVDDSPWYVSVLLALVLCFLYSFIEKKLTGTSREMILGFGMIFGTIAILAGYFVLTKTYIGVFIPAVSLTLTFLTTTIVNFIVTSHDKNKLRNMFNCYLSPDVINDMIDNPDKLKLGGTNKNLTALFTDVRSFSTISENLQKQAEKYNEENKDKIADGSVEAKSGAAMLVDLLNKYLTRMSDIVQDNQGTIDKYEGDAIIAFFGAPLDNADNAVCACRAAILMKKAEEQMNPELIEEFNLPFPIFTRIGINTGDIVVGNMGTPGHMNYTMMGNHVNLAARLEGVNKQYNTRGILISEYTREKIGDEFLLRPLDRVRVVGVKTPLRLYELLDIKNQASAKQLKIVEAWEKALELYEKRDYVNAKKIFEKILEADPEDRVAELYIARSQTFIESPREETWDGVFDLTQK